MDKETLEAYSGRMFELTAVIKAARALHKARERAGLPYKSTASFTEDVEDKKRQLAESLATILSVDIDVLPVLGRICSNL